MKISMRLVGIFCFYSISILICLGAGAQDSSSKRSDNLFHATPKAAMRQFVTDRPDATESPYTLDAGHFQLETDLFKTERSEVAGIKTTMNYYNVANIKLGITSSLDIQVIAGSFFTSKISDGVHFNKQSGFGGLTIRAKQNLWGNDGGKTAAALLPFVNIPTSSSERFSGGVVLPVAVELPDGWGLGAQIEIDIADDQQGSNYHLDYLASGTISHSLFKNLDFFTEGVITRDSETRAFDYFLDAGLVCSLKKNINADCGFYYGLRKTSSKTFFIGLSFRL
ncbi:MAG: transporter [Ginsengibacter sp.]